MLTLIAQMTMLTGLLLLCALPIALVFYSCIYFRSGVVLRGLWVSLMMSSAFLLAGVVSWYAMTPGWHLSFATTLAASVDSQSYGHPVEHTAENLLVAVLFFAVVSSMAAGALAGFNLRRR